MSCDPNIEFSKVSFWDERYQRLDGRELPAATTEDSTTAGVVNDDHEWIRTFAHLRPFLTKHLPSPDTSQPHILHLGTGTSTLPFDLYTSLGYKHQTCIDFSSVCVQLMTSRAPASQYPGLRFSVADIRYMTDFEQGTIDVALDKCALDALLHGSLWDPSDDVKENVGKYVNEVWRILKKGGSWICVTFRQPHFIRNLLKKDKEAGEHGGWESITQETLTEGGCFEYFGWVLRK